MLWLQTTIIISGSENLEGWIRTRESQVGSGIFGSFGYPLQPLYIIKILCKYFYWLLVKFQVNRALTPTGNILMAPASRLLTGVTGASAIMELLDAPEGYVQPRSQAFADSPGLVFIFNYFSKSVKTFSPNMQ